MLDKWIESIRKCELLPELDLKHLCEYVQELMLEESTVHPVSSPVTICGDIHGQFHDLLELFRTGGECPETSYIFMASAPPCLAAPLPRISPFLRKSTITIGQIFSPRPTFVTRPAFTLSLFRTRVIGSTPFLRHLSTSTWTLGPSGWRWDTASACLSFLPLTVAPPPVTPYKTTSATTLFIVTTITV